MIVVRAAGDVIHEGAHVTDAELDGVFRAARQRDRAATLKFSVEPTVPSKRMLELIDRARRAGLTKIAMVGPIVTTVPDRQPAAPAGPTLVLGLAASGALTVAGKPVAATAVAGVLRAAHAKAPNTQIVLTVRGDVAYGLVVDLMDRVKAIGFTEIALSSP